MRDPNRIDPLLEKLGEAWKKTPDQRFGQFMTNFFSRYGKDPFYAEDDAWMVGIQAYIDGEDMAAAMDAYRKANPTPGAKEFAESMEAVMKHFFVINKKRPLERAVFFAEKFSAETTTGQLCVV